MQPAVPLVHEFQINGRLELTVLATGLHQTNLTTTVDLVGVSGVDIDPSAVNPGLLAALKAAIQDVLIDVKSIPA